MRNLLDRIKGKAPAGKRRSSKWRKVRAVHLKENKKCAVCESKTKLEVHHIVPFHVNPSLELEPSNLMTLCERKKYGINCHLLIGHCGNYRRQNHLCIFDASYWNKKIKHHAS